MILDSNTLNNLTVCKQMCFDLFKMLRTNYSFVDHSYLMSMEEQGYALNNL